VDREKDRLIGLGGAKTGAPRFCVSPLTLLLTVTYDFRLLRETTPVDR
jgi:hypothetical protein